MSEDASVTKDLIQTAKDGQEGYAKGADKLADSNAPDLAATFREYSEQRAKFVTELQGLAQSYGDDIDKSGSVAGAVHRGWMAVKDALAGSDDPGGVLDAAEQGEDHAVNEYKKALDSDISPELRTVVQRQYADVRAAHDQMRSLREGRS
jgi:uncharacterized protein (TIGR02284 family)